MGVVATGEDGWHGLRIADGEVKPEGEVAATQVTGFEVSGDRVAFDRLAAGSRGYRELIRSTTCRITCSRGSSIYPNR